jgi:hypothetical protein
METNNMVPPVTTPKSGGFNLNIILKILGGLSVVFLMFLPVAGCEGTNQYNVNGIDVIFKAQEFDISVVFFALAVACGITIIFMRKSLLSLIFAGTGIITFLSSYFYVKSKSHMDVMELKVGAFLAIFSFIAVIVLSIIKMVTANKSAEPLQFQQPQPVPPPPVIPQNQQQYMPPQPQNQYVSPPPAPPAQQTPRPKFCSKCGNKFPENFQGKFCTSCGTKIPGIG